MCKPEGMLLEASSAPLDVAELMRRFLPACAQAHRLTAAQERVAWDITRCRTAALGGHLCDCKDCGHEWPSYNSCRNRHCPKCQGASQLEWIKARLQRVLNTHYFHVVFTLPEPLRPLALSHPGRLYDVMLRSAANTLLTLGRDEKWLGAELGVTVVLHTWARDLGLHPHVHCIVTGGGLTADGAAWRRTSPRYLFPGAVMADLFRNKVLAELDAQYQAGHLEPHSEESPAAELANPVVWAGVKDRLYRTRWVVHAKRPFAGPAQVIAYLGRYTHRVAISNSRLVALEGDRVRFRTRGDNEVTLTGVEFVRRFLLHVLPPGFRKIRHYGLMASINVRTLLAEAKALLEPAPPPLPDDDPDDDEYATDPMELLLRALRWEPCCPRCGSLRIGRVFGLDHPASTSPLLALAAGRPPPPTSGAEPVPA